MQRVTKFPSGPKQPPLFQWIHWIRNPLGFLDECGARYGHKFTVRFPGLLPMVWFAEPSAAEFMFATGRENFEARAGTAGNVFSAFVGAGSLLMMVGSRHRQERRLVDPLFHGQRLSSYDGFNDEIIDRAIDDLPIRRPFALYPVLEEIATNINIRGLGITDDEQCAHLRNLLFQYLSTLKPSPTRRIAAAAGLAISRPNVKRKLVGLKTEIYATLGQEIKRCREQVTEGRGDFVAKLVAARTEDSQTASEAEAKVCDQILTFLMAGHSTTATSLSWTLAHILGHRDIERCVQQELREVFGDEPAHSERTAELKYLDAVIKESLRLHPSFLLVTRRVLKETSLCGYELPVGTPVAIVTYLLHRRPDLWDNPGEFRPERFLGSRPSPFEYCPFGGGHRTCTGNAFAMNTSRAVLARLLSRAKLRIPLGVAFRPKLWEPFVPPQGGLPVIVDEVVRAGPRQGLSPLANVS